MNLPTPKTVVGKLILRVAVVALVAGLGYLLNQPEVAVGGVYYFAIKTLYDFLNSNVPNL